MSAQIDLHVHAEAPPRQTKKKWEEQNEEARITFHKTIDGHYRHGKTGYARVASLFLTWLDDDIQCKETEVGAQTSIYLNFTTLTSATVNPGRQLERNICQKFSLRDRPFRNPFRKMANCAATKSRRLHPQVRQSGLYGDHILWWTWLYRRRNRSIEVERVSSVIYPPPLLHISSIMASGICR